MERDKKKHHHTDGSERQKQKYLMAAKNRKLLAKIAYKVLCLAAIIVAALCVWAYFIDK